MNEIRTRELHLKQSKNKIDVEARTVEFSLSSEIEFNRGSYIEVLGHDEKEIDLKRLKETGSILVDHNTTDIVGTIEDAWLDPVDRVVRVRARFGKSARANEVFQDVVDNIRRTVSVGYKVLDAKEMKTRNDGLPVIRVTKWQPYEASFVAVPADETVGTFRNEDLENKNEVRVMENKYTDEQIKEIEKKLMADATRAERERSQGIREIASSVRHLVEDVDSIADKFINSERSVADFQGEVLKRMDRVEKPVVQSSKPATSIDMPNSDIEKYSVSRALHAVMTNDWSKAGLEREASEAVSKLVRRSAKGVYIPYDALAYRDAATTTSANDLVYTSDWGSQYIEWLRNKTVLGQLGASFYPGLTDSISIPKISTGSTASWVTETNTGSTTTQLTTDAVTLSPNLLYAPMAATKTLIAQAVNPSIDSILRDDLNRAIVGKIDETALVGASGGTSPVGVLYTNGTNLVSVGTAITHANMVKFETEIASDNCDVAGMKYVTNAKVAGRLKTTLKDSGVSGYLLENGYMNGYPVVVTNAIPTISASLNGMLFGNWQHLLVGMWGGVDITVDQITLAASGGLVLHCHALADIALRRNESFARSVDVNLA